jgi:hypothetical protein
MKAWPVIVKGRASRHRCVIWAIPLFIRTSNHLCRMASEAGLNSHVGTNFSFMLSDQRIADIVTSGLTLLTVCVDDLSRETYGLTRVGGRYPRVEVQFIKFQHTVDELQLANRRSRALGVDQICPKIFDTKIDRLVRTGDEYRWEDL